MALFRAAKIFTCTTLVLYCPNAGNIFSEKKNKEAIVKDRVVKATELQAVLRGRKLAMGLRRTPALALFNL